MPARRLHTRQGGTCAGCGAPRVQGLSAWWGTAPRFTCDACRPGCPAGASAQRQFDRRAARYHAEVWAAHPHLGGLLLWVRGDPPPIRAWGVGAAGERAVGRVLDALAADGVHVLHDRRRRPGARANLDHLAVGPSAVWVIDTKARRGLVTRRVRRWLRREERLFVDGRDRTALVAAMGPQVDAVRAALGEAWAWVPVRPALCFVGAQWDSPARPFEVGGVAVAWPSALAELIRSDGRRRADSRRRADDRRTAGGPSASRRRGRPLPGPPPQGRVLRGPLDAERVAAHLAAALPPAR